MVKTINDLKKDIISMHKNKELTDESTKKIIDFINDLTIVKEDKSGLLGAEVYEGLLEEYKQ